MIDFKTDKIVVVAYPAYSGGKFLINCLGLSDNAILQHKDFIDYTIAEKWNEIKTQLAIADHNGEWADLGMGCAQLFGDDPLNPDTFNEEIDRVSNSGRYFFIAAHFRHILQRVLEIWPNAQIISYFNGKDFVNSRDPVPYEGDIDTQQFNNTIPFDTSVYFDEERTVDAIRSMYNRFGLTDFNESIIREYYNTWISVIRK